MKKLLLLVFLAILSGGAWAAESRENDVDRVDAAPTVLDEIMAAPE